MALVLLLAGVGAVLWWRYQVGLKAIERDLEALVEREQAALASADVDMLRALLDNSGSRLWQATQEYLWEQHLGQDIDLQVVGVHLLAENLVAVAITGWPSQPSTRGRIYRRWRGRWLWTEPTESLWGPEIVVPLPCGKVHGRELDRRAVEEMAKRRETTCTLLQALTPALGA